MDEEYSNSLPRIRRLITTHDSNGHAIFSRELPEEANFWRVDKDVGFYVGYTLSAFPAPLTEGKDLIDYKASVARSKQSGLVNKEGIVMRYVDYPPGSKSPMHRTVSLDYGFVLEGELECRLDSGESRIMRRGDVAVQRGTMHQWINRSDTQWARMVYILIAATPVRVDGSSLGEDLADMKGVPPS